MRFPNGDKGRVRGFDGHLISQLDALYVPKGKSVWEFGTAIGYKAKAVKDFKKRSKDTSLEVRKKTTYVFVSPWAWDSSNGDNKLEDFVESQKSEYEWLAVIYIDGCKLETWLESCPAVAAWHARNTVRCKPQIGARSMDEFWAYFVGKFDPKIVEEILLSGRAKNATDLVNQLMGPPERIKLSADSTDEVIAFAIAAIRFAEPNIRLFLEARTLIVDTLIAGRELLNNNKLVFLLNAEAASSPGQFYDIAPTLVPLGRRQKNVVATTLDRPTGHELGRALEKLGYSETEALTLARGCGRSLSALQRRIPSGSYNHPDWFEDMRILPAILAGAWDGRNDADREVIQLLAGDDDYGELAGYVRRLSKKEDPPFVLEGDVWKVRAPTDAFIHTAGNVNMMLFDKFATVVKQVFSAVQTKEQHEASFSNGPKIQSPYSAWLREGLSNTLLMISALGEQTEVGIDDDHGKRFVDEIVSELPCLNGNTELLACLQGELPLLAEASPASFLQALELWLEGDSGSLREIFTEEEGVFTPITYHQVCYGHWKLFYGALKLILELLLSLPG